MISPLNNLKIVLEIKCVYLYTLQNRRISLVGRLRTEPQKSVEFRLVGRLKGGHFMGE